MSLHLTPVSFSTASEFVALHHRHHKPPPGHVFSVGVADGDELCGVAMVGRPIARHYDDGLTLEVNRTCVADARNANSMLYGAATRAAFALGYRRQITYTEAGESGASLKAAGWRIVAERPARGDWDTPTRRRENPGRPNVQRYLWEAS